MTLNELKKHKEEEHHGARIPHGSRGGSSSSRKSLIYNNGTWYKQYENPGSFKVGSSTPTGFTINQTYLSSNTAQNSLIGTSYPINFTTYSTLHMKAKSSGYLSLYASSSKQFDNPAPAQMGLDTNGTVQEWALDISNLSGDYYVSVECYTGRSGEIYEIWLS